MSPSEQNFTLYQAQKGVRVGGCVDAHILPVGTRQASSIERRFCHRNAVEAIEESLQIKRPFSVAQVLAAEEPLCLPATVAIEFEEMGRDGDNILMFAGPRPSPLRIKHGDKAILDIILLAKKEGKAVVFAVSDSFYATDAMLIPIDVAKNFLGFSDKPS